MAQSTPGGGHISYDTDEGARGARAARMRSREAHEQARVAHQRAADLHDRTAAFQEKHAAGERKLGNLEKADQMEALARKVRARAWAERLRAER